MANGAGSKNAAAAVRGMLGTAGASYRPSDDARPSNGTGDDRTTFQPPAADQTESTQELPANDGTQADLPPEEQPREGRASSSGHSAPTRSRLRRPECDEAQSRELVVTTTGDKAPRTIRLSQPMADALRSAWVDARLAGEPLISYQDFADRIVSAGLAATWKSP